MSNQITLRVSVLILLLILVPSALAQKSSPSPDPQNKPRRVTPEPANAFKQWIDDVDAILTPQERSAWKKLVIEDNLLNSAVQISYFKQSDDRVIVAFTVQTDNKDLVFSDVGGIQTARLNIYGRITAVADRRVGFFEDAATTTATTTELVEAKERKSAYL